MTGAELINERGKSTKSLVGFESLSPTDSWISSEYHQCKCPSMFRRKLSQLSSDVLKATARATQSCWEKECKCSRADVVRAQLRTEQNAAAKREELADGQARAVALQNPVSPFRGVPLEARWHLGRHFLFKDPNTPLHARRLTKKLEAVWRCLGILLWFREGFLYPGPWV